MLSQEVYIKEKSMLYTSEDIEEFSIQIKELLRKGLKCPSKESYSSPAVIVMNKAEKTRNKSKIVINYKNLTNLQKLTIIFYLINKF